MQRPRSTIVLVHGAWHDDRCWAQVTAHLDRRRAPWAHLTLPSTDPGRDLPGFADDVSSVMALIDQLDGEVTLCGHAYGGMVISEAGNHDRVTRLVYLAACCPEPGERMIDMTATGPPVLPSLPSRSSRAVRVIGDGRTMIRSRYAARTFYGDLAPEVAAEKAAMLRPSTAAILRARANNPAWINKPSTYVVCGRDRALSVRRERQIAYRVVRRQIAYGRVANHAVTLDTGHSPFYSAPHLVAELLADAA